MVVRRRRKKNKLRGQRSHGKGNTKNKRGGGCRGGRGRAGSHKHKFSKYYASFGTKRKLKTKAREAAINLDKLNESIHAQKEKEKTTAEAGAVVVDGKKMGFGKILGRGSIGIAIIVRNSAVSETAKQKIEKAGGRVEEAAKQAEIKKSPIEKQG